MVLILIKIPFGKKIKTPPKIKTFWWRVINNYMPVRAILAKLHPATWAQDLLDNAICSQALGDLSCVECGQFGMQGTKEIMEKPQ